MKRSNRVRTPHRAKNQSEKRNRRVEMHRVVRRLLLFTLLLVLAAVAVAFYSTLQPLTMTWPVRTLDYTRQADFSYQVQLKPDTFGDRSVLPMDQVYLRDTVASVDVAIRYQVDSDPNISWQSGHQLNARVEIRDATAPDRVLLSRSVPLLPDQPRRPSGSWQIEEQVLLDLDEFTELAAFTAPDDVELKTFLTLQLTVLAETELLGGRHVFVDEPVLQIPLFEPMFQISRPDSAIEEVSVRQPVTYQLVLTPLPIFVYPLTAGLALILLILLLFATRSRPKVPFRRRLRRMLRRARSRLVLISDKAWEPEWCIRASDFKSMLRTAKKLRHPIFCYIDQAGQTAYFYIHIGENNYCFIYGNQPPAENRSVESGPQTATDIPDRQTEDELLTIPVLPEDDTEPQGAESDSPEIMLSRLRMQINQGHT